MHAFIASRPRCACSHDQADGCTYRVAWKINPHMRIGAVRPARACAQHAAFLRALRAAGARVLQLPFLHGAYDSVFMKDSAILAAYHGSLRALPTTPRHAVRRHEPAIRAAQLARVGLAIAQPLAAPLEGGDVVPIAHRKVALLGHGIRSHSASAPGLARFLGCGVITLALRDPTFFHLDTALAVLADDTLLLCERAFTDDALRTLARMRFRRTISVAPEAASGFALNFVEVGDSIVTGTPSVALAAELGRPMIVSPLDELQLAGGRAACLVARVHPQWT
jgi:N-dimethylarginine dimethylaminohydrolase